MVSLSCSASPFQSTLGFHRPNHIPTITSLKLGFTIPPTALNFRCRVKNGIRLQVRQRLLTPSASNTNSSDGDSLKEESDERKIGDANQGPPFLTILAGLLVFLFISWVIGSIVMWLIGLIVHLPPSK